MGARGARPRVNNKLRILAVTADLMRPKKRKGGPTPSSKLLMHFARATSELHKSEEQRYKTWLAVREFLRAMHMTDAQINTVLVRPDPIGRVRPRQDPNGWVNERR